MNSLLDESAFENEVSSFKMNNVAFFTNVFGKFNSNSGKELLKRKLQYRQLLSNLTDKLVLTSSAFR